MAQKVIEGGIVTWRHMHEILRWLNFELAQNLDHVSKPRDGSLFQTWNSEMAQNSKQSISRIQFLFEFWAISEFRSEKVSTLGVLTRDRDFEPFCSWAISKSHAYASTWQHLLRWLFEPSQGPPRILFSGWLELGKSKHQLWMASEIWKDYFLKGFSSSCSGFGAPKRGLIFFLFFDSKRRSLWFCYYRLRVRKRCPMTFFNMFLLTSNK